MKMNPTTTTDASRADFLIDPQYSTEQEAVVVRPTYLRCFSLQARRERPLPVGTGTNQVTPSAGSATVTTVP
jgi:hypothetical protein